LSTGPDASDVLRGGLVARDTSCATRQFGATDPDDGPSTTALASTVRERFGADIGLALTGVAPGDPAPEAEPGTVAWAIVGPGESRYREQTHIVGDRAIVQSRSVAFVLESLRRRLR
jgi:nicotinamide mononucleotide (NMN) deamidase PncC